MQEEYGHNMAYYMEIRTEKQQQKKDIHKPCVTKIQGTVIATAILPL